MTVDSVHFQSVHLNFNVYIFLMHTDVCFHQLRESKHVSHIKCDHVGLWHTLSVSQEKSFKEKTEKKLTQSLFPPLPCIL